MVVELHIASLGWKWAQGIIVSDSPFEGWGLGYDPAQFYLQGFLSFFQNARSEICIPLDLVFCTR